MIHKIDFNKALNTAAEDRTILDDAFKAVAQGSPGPFLLFSLGTAGQRDFSYGQAVNVTSQGGRASFKATAVIPAGYEFHESRGLRGTVKIGQIAGNCTDLPYVRQYNPQQCLFDFPFTPDHGWEVIAGESGLKILRWQHVFGFGPDCVPLKTTSFPLSFRGFSFYSAGGSLPVDVRISQQNNPEGIITVGDSGHTMNIAIKPTCEGAPVFTAAPPPGKV